MKSLVIVFLVCLGQQHFINEVCGDRYSDDLARHLLKDYTSIADPGNITLEIGLALIDIEFDSESDVLTATLWERYKWTDDRLRWNPAEYGGVTNLRLPDRNLWTPDVMIYNPYGGKYSRTSVNAIVGNDGEIFWVPPSVLQVRCSRNHGTEDKTVTMEDNDVITCPIKMGSWTYDGGHIHLKTLDNAADLTVFSPSNKYSLKAYEGKVTTAKYECCPEPWMSYDVTIKLEPITRGPRSG